MNFNHKKNTILMCVHGSHAYGLNNETSDLDLRGVLIEPKEFVISFNKNFEQTENVQFEGYEESKDCTIFGLRKFCKLAADANPNVLEILFVEESEVLFKNRFGKALVNFRDNFLSKKAFYTFGGYAKGQLKRLENHREWVINPPKPPVSRKDFGLPEYQIIPGDQVKAALAAINKKIENWNFSDMSELDRAERIEFINVMAEILSEMKLGADEQFISAGKVLSYDTNFLLMLDKERTYKGICEQYKQYEQWIKNRNPKRFETEQKCYCDTKHASHLIRLYMECVDLLDGKGLVLKRPTDERNLLLNIKNGIFKEKTYEIIIDLKNMYEEKLNKSLQNSKLSHGPDLNKIDEFMRNLYENYWKEMSDCGCINNKE